MKISLRAVFALVLLVALMLTLYRVVYAPPVLNIGMHQDDAINALQRSNAADMIELRVSSNFTVSPIKRPSTAREIAEYRRISAVEHLEDNFQTYWYLPSIGRFETHFKMGKLESIVRWSGTSSKEVDQLTLELRRDDPYENAGVPTNFQGGLSGK